MTRSLRLVGLAALIVLGCSWPAQAGLLDILEELSGPGPFREGGSLLFTGLCRTVAASNKTYSTHRLAGIPGSVDVDPPPERPADPLHPNAVATPPYLPCFFADFRKMQSAPDLTFPRKTHATTVDVGLTFPLVRPIEIGAGAGWIRFSTAGVSPIHRFTFTPLRVVVKPLFFIPKHQKHDQLAFLKYFIKETIIYGHLRGEHFGVANTAFDSPVDYVTSSGFIIDIGEIISK